MESCVGSEMQGDSHFQAPVLSGKRLDNCVHTSDVCGFWCKHLAMRHQ